MKGMQGIKRKLELLKEVEYLQEKIKQSLAEIRENDEQSSRDNLEIVSLKLKDKGDEVIP